MSRALILLTLLCAGCAPSPGALLLTDETGCQWKSTIYRHEKEDRYGEIEKIIGADGKQICGKGK